MRFYYLSIISILLLLLIWSIGTWLLVRLGAQLKESHKRVWPLMLPLFMLLYLGPIAEEFYIAWNFDRLCKKDAGIFVYKTVQVDGFYDGTMRSGYVNTGPDGYRFMEHASEDRKGFERVERADEKLRQKALDWYAQTHRGKEGPKDRSIFYPLNDQETIAVMPNGVDAWRIKKLERPTARYHYRWPSDRSVSYKIEKIERMVIDSHTDEVLARETKYRRTAPWFYIGLDRPVMLCPAPGEHPLSKYGSVFNLALKPKGRE